VSGTNILTLGDSIWQTTGMGRAIRAADDGLVYYVLNRVNGRMRIFDDQADFEAFERILSAAVQRTGTDLLAFCLMPNHWHLVVMPPEEGELSRFVRWLSLMVLD
jgi:putative transposase